MTFSGTLYNKINFIIIIQAQETTKAEAGKELKLSEKLRCLFFSFILFYFFC